jgi:hypothetical protein|tara:strand:+ start:580 stop:939 length:360 start_codon:yes stop_codon:yes gene_type:complete
MSNQWKTQFVKPENLKAHLKAGGTKMKGQIVKFNDKDHNSRLAYTYVRNDGRKVEIHLHGEDSNKRTNVCYKADKKRIILPHEPQQFRNQAKNIPSDKLNAIAGIALAEVQTRNESAQI